MYSLILYFNRSHSNALAEFDTAKKMKAEQYRSPIKKIFFFRKDVWIGTPAC